MEQVLSGLVRDFETGRISRRQLIQGLAIAAAAAYAPKGSLAAQGGGFKTIELDHISYQVKDYRVTRDFYSSLMGMSVSDDNGKNQCELHFGNSLLIARNHFHRPGQPVDPDPKPLVDHIAYRIADWDTDRVKAELEKRGLKPTLDTNAGPNDPHYVSFHVQDPDGFNLQISGHAKPGDSEYNPKPGKKGGN